MKLLKSILPLCSLFMFHAPPFATNYWKSLVHTHNQIFLKRWKMEITLCLNITRIANAVQCYSLLSDHYDCHELRLLIFWNGQCSLVLDTFENSSAERVPSECSQSRYIADIFHKDIYVASPDILPIYFTKTYFKTSKTCGSKSVNQKACRLWQRKEKKIVFWQSRVHKFELNGPSRKWK